MISIGLLAAEHMSLDDNNSICCKNFTVLAHKNSCYDEFNPWIIQRRNKKKENPVKFISTWMGLEKSPKTKAKNGNTETE